MSLADCRASLVHQQRLITSETRSILWTRLPSYWSNDNGVFVSYFDQIRYESDVTDNLRIRSWIHYDSAATNETPVFVGNSMTFKFC